ncbi:MAG: hypothetical protein ROO76_20190 [Terriglobia bacterium]|nr:hypothetical protein [Terriglobia bacterium]
MRSRRRNLVIVITAVVVVATAIGIAVYLRKRAAPEPARLLPDSDAVLYFNLKTVRRLTNFGSTPVVQREPEYEDFVRATGFQFERDLNEAAFAVHIMRRPPAKPGLPATTEPRYSEVFVGKFDSQKLSAYLRKLSKSVDQYRDTDIYNIPVEDRTVRIAILDVDSVAGSNVDDPKVIRGIIDRSRSAAMPFSGPPLVSRYYHDIPIGSLVWAVAKIPAAPKDPRAARAFTLPGGIDILIPSESTMVAWVRYLGSIHFRADFYTATNDDAKHFVDQASGFLTLFKSIELNAQPGQNEAEFKSALDSLQVKQDGSKAILSANIPTGFFKKMLEEPPVDVTGAQQETPAQPSVTAPPAKKKAPANNRH